ncbi:hypothetical protein SAMN05421770_107185 [Granulicella rosea]|uniref:Uncharacterized protein n=1 Tax=Granulicella rosea TaxID=474952 RepID=A0A239LPI5_9BACT|nr:hypothetical protein [Granulicella rosea]SNT32361.1 hypothetical protein SAMN05421770_107185 [Granulicella rosea]
MHLTRVGKAIGLAAGVVMGVATLGIAGSERLAAPGQMPPNTVALSDMMRELSEKPGFTDAVMDQIQHASKAGAALLTPTLMHRMRELILGKDWQGLDRFPGWTMREINPTVRVVGHVAGKDEAVEKTATAGGKPSGGNTPAPAAPKNGGPVDLTKYLDLGPYALDASGSEDLDKPSTRPGFSEAGLVSSLGDGVVRGDGPDERVAPMHSESARLAEVLNRLSMNIGPVIMSPRPDEKEPFIAWMNGQASVTPEELMQALIATGHDVMVADSRYFANFGHFHYKGQDVMMPFWVNAQIVVPGTNRPLLVPVSHAEYEWFIRGPKINADVSFYFGIDGKAEFRTMDQKDQPWVMNRHAHEYRGKDAVEVTRLTGRMIQTYAHQHQARPTLPFGGYYALGVCQDVVAAIELKLTGKTTLFPNTADGSLFTDERDAEINDLIRRIPKDRNGRPPEPERIFGSLPTEDLAGVTIPGLGPDLVAVHQAWHDGTLERTRPKWRRVMKNSLYGVGLVLAVGTLLFVRRRRNRV